MSDFDWSVWAANYPARVAVEPALGSVPTVIQFQRASQRVWMTPEELTAALAELGFTLTPPPEPVAYIVETRHRHCQECNDLIDPALNGARMLAGPVSGVQRDGHGVTVLHQTMAERRAELSA